MAEQINPFSITAPGYMGLNTQDAPVDMKQQFALEANNCVIDKFGRVGARKGWSPVHTTNTDLGSNPLEAIGEYVAPSGTRTIICAGNGFIFKLTGSTLTTLTYGGGGSAPVISANNWQMASMNGALTLFQEGYDPLIYDPALSTTQFRRCSEHPSYSGTIIQGHCGISAYGRLWTARTPTDKNLIKWCDLLIHYKWNAGSAGSLDLTGVWPHGGDEIVALATHNNSLFIFGTKQILIYTGANDPATMELSDSIGNTGCVGRDTVQNTGADIFFLSDSGLRSVMRTIQEKSAPLRNISRNVNNDVLDYLNNEVGGATVKSAYSPIDSFYLLTFVTSGVTYCFDTRTALEDGSSRATFWPNVKPRTYHYSKDRILYVGQVGYLAKYDSYYDNGESYRMTYYSSWIDFGNPVMTSILKKIVMTLFGAINQTVVYKWGFDYIASQAAQPTVITDVTVPAEYNVAEYGIAEYARNLLVKSLGVCTTGSGKVIQIGFEAQLLGYPISIQRVDIFTKDGALK